jgi:hypothetical protein
MTTNQRGRDDLVGATTFNLRPALAMLGQVAERALVDAVLLAGLTTR